MPIAREEVDPLVYRAAAILFERDSRITAVGLGENDGRPVIRAVRNSARVLPLSGSIELPEKIGGFAVQVVYEASDVVPLIKLPIGGAGGASGAIGEQQRQDPICCGLQIQNFDFDVRSGNIGNNLTSVGTLGCFVKLDDGRNALLSNNHVIAGENRGVVKTDRILQPGAGSINSGDEIAVLEDFVPLQPSPSGIRPPDSQAVLNRVDAAVAVLSSQNGFDQGFLPMRGCPPLFGEKEADRGDRVIKVGRTTAKTIGKITSVGTIVGPVTYDIGDLWFSGCYQIESETEGGSFSRSGDSGSVVITEQGEIVGLLFAGSDEFTYACPIEDVLTRLRCSPV